MGSSRGGLNSRFDLATDGRGLSRQIKATAGQAPESTYVESMMDQIAIPQPAGRPHQQTKRLAGDTVYSYNRARD